MNSSPKLTKVGQLNKKFRMKKLLAIRQISPKQAVPMVMDFQKWLVYDPKKNEILGFRADCSAVGEPDPRKAGLDMIENVVTSGKLTLNQLMSADR